MKSIFLKKIKIFKNNSVKEVFIKGFKRTQLKYKYYNYKFNIAKNFEPKKDFSFKNYEPSMMFFYNPDDKKEIKKFYKKNPEIANLVMGEADLILNHNFNLLGSESVNLNDEIKWNRDFISNFEWTIDFYKDTTTIDLTNNSDVKVPWELSRFQHFFTLGKAFWITEDEKYYLEFKNEIISWEKQNPFAYSVNWTCAMEVGIRAINWIFAYFHFKEKIDLDIDFKENFLNLLFKHGKFIYDNLENYAEFKNNHYLSNLVGLLYLGIFFQDIKENKLQIHKKWLSFSIKELEKELRIQINDDGSSYETSTGYHRLITELFFYTLMICEKNNIKLSNRFREYVIKMHEFLMYVTKPNGLTPLIGDIDNGRLIIISELNWNKRFLNHTMGMYEQFFKKNLLNKNIKVSNEEIIWILGEDRKLSFPSYEKEQHRSYPNGGIYKVYNKDIFCIIRCGELSMKGQGGHSHNDQLSVEINFCGEDFFIDPGSFSYTGYPAIRNQDRSTSNHNTLVIKDIEQNNIGDDLFTMKEETFSKVLSHNYSNFEGEHYGYNTKKYGIHNRKIYIENNKLYIKDLLKEKAFENKDIYQNFILHPNVKVLSDKNGVVLQNKNVKIKMNLNNYSIKETFVSFGYGNREKTLKILNPLDKEIQIQIL